MSHATLFKPEPAAPPAPGPRRAGARTVHAALLRERDGEPGQVDDLARQHAHAFLADRLAAASRLPDDLPDDPRELVDWIEQGRRRVADAYRIYLEERRTGQPRRYFTNRSHALFFLRAAAPTKLVDGAWLYGLLQRWDDARYAALVRIYLEELGEGRADRNHVVLYRKLLEDNGCEAWDRPDDEVFVQGAIQLSLAHHANDYLPELIGFNLGYEQLPLHLLITAYELAELGIDPYYFTLHVTVDNASTGHARKSLQSVMDAAPRLGDAGGFYRRVRNGYRLNDLGMGTTDLIDAFDLERELTGMLARKADVGAGLHSDYCRIGGRTVNEWLAEPSRMADFLKALVTSGWIKRGRDPRESRFWQLLDGDAPPMFGVFSRCEQQLLHDWIAGDWVPAGEPRGADGSAVGEPAAPPRRFRRRPMRPGALPVGQPPAERPNAGMLSIRQLVDGHFAGVPAVAGDEATGAPPADFDAEFERLHQHLAGAVDRRELMARLGGLLSPAHHSTPAGLLATRIFCSVFTPS